MRCVLLSGGSGNRLWPLSNGTRSKQFLKVLRGEDGAPESMVQRVWRQLGRAGLAPHCLIAAPAAQREMLQLQLGAEVPIIEEPERRDTFAAIALSAVYLYDREGCGRDQFVAVLPVDPYVDDEYFEVLRGLERHWRASGAEMVLMGAEPTYPSAKYGYILPVAGRAADYVEVERFVEKPGEAEAAEYIRRGALWNCGVFGFALDLVLGRLEKRGLPLRYEALAARYGELPRISFDYEVVERCRRLIAVPYRKRWKDLGTWYTLTEEMSEAVIGKGLLGPGAENTHIVNELDIPVCVLGVSGAVVAASSDGILVTSKEASPRLKELAPEAAAGRPMYEERLWGWQRILEYSRSDDGQEVLTKRICIRSGKNLAYQIHRRRSEIWTVVSGTGEAILNGECIPLRPGSVLKVGPGDRHAIRGETDLQLIEVQIGNPLIEADIERLGTDWEAMKGGTGR